MIAFLNQKVSEPKKPELKPLSPASYEKELKALNKAFDSAQVGEMTPEQYETAKKYLLKRRQLWFGQIGKEVAEHVCS